MNHLSGLSVPSPTADLNAVEHAALVAFRAAHEAARPPDSDLPNPARGDDSPIFNIDPSSLPPCGWRPLDDATLYRFLCADQRSGKFQHDKSVARLKKALKFRKEGRVDELLKSTEAVVAGRERNGSTAAAGDGFQRSDSVTSMATSIASGTFVKDDVILEDFVVPASVAVSDGGEDSDSSQQRGFNPDKKRGLRHADQTLSTHFPASPSLICPDDLAKYQRLRVRVFVGTTESGEPVMFERMGEFLGSGNVRHFSEEEWIRLYVWDLERHFTAMRDAAAKTERPIQRYTYCGDAKGIVSSILNGTVWSVVPLLKALAKAVEEHYPEIADRIILFNVPRVATVLYNAVRKFLDPVTAEKIELHSGVPKKMFFKLMGEEMLPVEYGGQNAVDYPKAVRE
eukprot:CAMPEP_0183290952 /NCGR_PEP_ID=MMETSP0160_2-20130417/522_1 /TAXON_ID=2839 ORGANISM="Odontella Sinensis, Strain Grunow 1884" /NCGR_SAMPLE_ID=MMETSP0160_2 /ASSEMBLY_ACC=CAM_ASM_000250 /LENGTH=397 /DNA_ID=CAMNT_0025451673 /DNA_START=35 /DNA_END=1228 /DNA_ORIENTATION=+